MILQEHYSYQKDYDLVHIDIADNKFCPTYGISENILNDILKNEEYEVDIHLMFLDHT